MSGFVGANVVDNQLQTGQIEIPTVTAAVQDSGVIAATSDERNIDQREDKRQGTEGKNKKCHQGIQTKMFTLSVAIIHGHDHMKKP